MSELVLAERRGPVLVLTLGLGLVEALYCDVRFATPEAKLTTAFARRGLVAEYGILACDASASITGEDMNVSAGLTMY